MNRPANHRVATLPERIGHDFGCSTPKPIDQPHIDHFGECTGDDQWIGVKRARTQMPGGRTIAHGLLLLGLLPAAQYELGVYLYRLFAMWGWTSWHRLHRIEAPTLVPMGVDDPIVPPVNGRIIAARVRPTRLEAVDCGHLFVLTRPFETARRVERFIAAHPFAA
jgi:pimeloyl-ACP methyl ester carboxylesterase